MRRWLAGLFIAFGGCAAAVPVTAQPQRIVSLGGSVTEIVFTLGQGARLVADDASSLYPEAATRLPQVGYYRSVALEGVVAMRPDLILASENAGPPHALRSLSDLGVAVRTVSDAPSLDSLYLRVEQIAAQLHVPEQGGQLIEQIRRDVASAKALPVMPRRVLLVLNRTQQLMGAGHSTAASEVLSLAGLENSLADQQGYKPVSAEGLAVLAPDMIVTTSASVQASGGLEKFKLLPGVAATPAAQQNRIAVMDDLLILGLGPRVGEAIRQLKEAAR